MAVEMSVSGGVAPPITSGRTRRHRFLFLAQHKVGAELEPVFLEPEPGLFVWKTEELVRELEPARLVLKRFGAGSYLRTSSIFHRPRARVGLATSLNHVIPLRCPS